MELGESTAQQVHDLIFEEARLYTDHAEAYRDFILLRMSRSGDQGRATVRRALAACLASQTIAKQLGNHNIKNNRAVEATRPHPSSRVRSWRSQTLQSSQEWQRKRQDLRKAIFQKKVCSFFKKRIDPGWVLFFFKKRKNQPLPSSCSVSYLLIFPQ